MSDELKPQTADEVPEHRKAMGMFGPSDDVIVSRIEGMDQASKDRIRKAIGAAPLAASAKDA